MKAEKLLKKLTEKQKKILAQASEGKSIDESNLKEVKSNVELQVQEEILASEYGLCEELWEDYIEVYRYLNSMQDDEETRKENLIKFAIEEYKSIQEVINKSIENGKVNVMDIVEYGYRQEHAILPMIGMSYGFTDREVKKLLNDMEITFKGINWEEVEVQSNELK